MCLTDDKCLIHELYLITCQYGDVCDLEEKLRSLIQTILVDMMVFHSLVSC